ncbi:MAG: FliA/WhiG family RNA polymerase sigma factor [Gemmatimonadales bacterium]|nr:FliA/WhiG family RNA polymerase sigma factor [Gemmatimonadales bacterium]
MTATEGLWRRYRESADLAAREALIEQHLGLVRHAAHTLSARIGDAVSFDDLVSAGSLGLLQAVEGFDLSRGFAFTTYALQRIRGAMLDELRAADWRPRSVRVRGRQIQAAERDIEARTGRPAAPGEVAETLGVDLPTYWEWRGDAETGAMVAYDDVRQGADPQTPTLADRLADPEAATPVDALERADRETLVRRGLERLSARHRLVVTLSYYEGLSNRQIAEVLHVGESRVSQLRSGALAKLRAHLEEMEAL